MSLHVDSTKTSKCSKAGNSKCLKTVESHSIPLPLQQEAEYLCFASPMRSLLGVAQEQVLARLLVGVTWGRSFWQVRPWSRVTRLR